MLFVIVVLFTSVIADLEPTTTKTYDIEVPGSEPIRIVEGEPLWKTKFEHRSFNTEDSPDPLHQFLTNYAENVRNKNKNSDESSEKPKSWDLLHYQNHNHPYDDKKGWVSMEPVPWSVSKISKWQSNYRPTNPKPWDDYNTQETQQAHPWSKPPNYDVFYLDSKPSSTAVYSQKVHVTTNRYQHKHDENCKHTRPYDSDIITDGRPANFPHQPYEAARRKSTELHPDNHPFSGDGEWVLLSTTKGYKYPQQQQRSLQVNPESVGAHRSVRLTVLPPLKNSKVNMTTSHGGLLQVESSFQTVEQAQKQYHKKQKLKKKPVKAAPVKVLTPRFTTTRRNSPDSSAVLAAVGAGMIPATMAMLVPMALGGRRRRDLTSTEDPQVTLPRNL